MAKKPSHSELDNSRLGAIVPRQERDGVEIEDSEIIGSGAAHQAGLEIVSVISDYSQHREASRPASVKGGGVLAESRDDRTFALITTIAPKRWRCASREGMERRLAESKCAENFQRTGCRQRS